MSYFIYNLVQPWLNQTMNDDARALRFDIPPPACLQAKHNLLQQGIKISVTHIRKSSSWQDVTATTKPFPSGHVNDSQNFEITGLQASTLRHGEWFTICWNKILEQFHTSRCNFNTCTYIENQ